jgi:hypothetical protein
MPLAELLLAQHWHAKTLKAFLCRYNFTMQHYEARHYTADKTGV